MTSRSRRNSVDWIPVVRYLFISAGVISLSLLLFRFVPPAVHFAMSELPSVGVLLLSFFRPPYLYLLINAIIMSILASARFTAFPDSPPQSVIPESGYSDLNSDPHMELNQPSDFALSSLYPLEQEEKDELVVFESELIFQQQKRESMESVMDSARDSLIPEEKPLFSTRFGRNKDEQSSQEGVKVVVVKEKMQPEMTIEGTWKKIMEAESRRMNNGRTAETKGGMTTLRDKSNKMEEGGCSGAGIKMLRAPSLSQEDLNRRAEAFIRKFNQEMRMQRQDSPDRYNKIIGF